MKDRLSRARGRMEDPNTGAAVPGSSPEALAVRAEFLRVVSAERDRIDREDAEALENPDDPRFDVAPPEPTAEALDAAIDNVLKVLEEGARHEGPA